METPIVERFWFPLDSDFPLGDNGYLFDPRSEYGKLLAPTAYTLDQVRQSKTVILIGEPGMGKSTVVAALASDNRRSASPLTLDLKSYATDVSLEQALRTREPVKAWLVDGAEVEVFLDSYDECAIPSKITVIPRILADLAAEPGSIARCPSDSEPAVASTHLQSARTELSDVAPALPPSEPRNLTTERKGRLKVRLVCRSGAFSHALWQELAGNVDVDPTTPKVFKLAPLRRTDVAAFVALNGGDSEEFIGQVWGTGATILAAIPLTLRLLLTVYQRSGSLPSSITDLYRLGMKVLSDEPSDLLTAVDTSQRMLIAGELALLCVACGKARIWRGRESELDRESDIWCGEALRHSPDQVRQFGLPELKEALCSGLFTAVGPSSVTWTHWTFAEFLAAWHLDSAGLSLNQLRDIFVHWPTGHVFVPLQETAAWLAAMNKNFLDWLVEQDPECVLRTDVSGLGDEMKAKIADILLAAFEKGTVRDQPELRDHYQTLNHPSLVGQLRPWIRDKTKTSMARRVAIDIAERCKLTGLERDVVDVALDQLEDHYIRGEAARFIWTVGSSQARSRLKPLAIGQAGSDPDDTLRGYGLRSCWPDFLPADEVFGCLTREKRPSYFGAYAAFCLYDFKQHLKAEHLPAALRWVWASFDQQSLGWNVDNLRSLIATKALAHCDQSEVLEPLARILSKGLKEHRDVFEWDEDGVTKESFQADVTTRRLLVAEIIRQATGSAEPLQAYHLRDLCGPDGFEWALQRAALHPSNSSVETAWAQLALAIEYWPIGQRFDQVFTASKKSRAVASTFQHVLGSVVFGSPEAQEQKAEFIRWKALSKPRRRPRRNRKIAQLIHDRFSQAKSDAASLWLCNVAMSFDEFGGQNANDLVEQDIKKLPGWQVLTKQERDGWSELCKGYLTSTQAQPNGWEPGYIVHPDVAGYRAIRNLLETDEAFILGQDDEFFLKWVPAIAMMTGATFGDEDETDKHILDIFFQRCHSPLLRFVGILVDREADRFDYPFIVEKLERLWNQDLETLYLSKLKSGRLKPAYESKLLSKLLAHGSDGARLLAEARTRGRDRADLDGFPRSVGAAQALLVSAFDGGREFLLPILLEDPAFSSDVLTGAIHRSTEPAVPLLVARLGVVAAIQLYRIICLIVPYEADPDWTGGAANSVQALRMYRDALIRHVISMGTSESHAALKGLAENDPPLPNVSWWLLESESNLRRNDWKPLSPQTLMKLVATAEGRVVDSEGQLMQVVIEALAEIDKKLRDEIRLLWNIPGKGDRSFKCHPKEEEDLSDYVRERLDERIRRRGVVINREVQVRRGQKTDILVEAIARGPKGKVDIVSATVEVKCSWNDELDRAMETQLLDRYLHSDKRNAGVFLVGWFECANWIGSGHKRKRNRMRANTEPSLENQARTLSNGQKRIVYIGLDCTMA